MAKYIRTNDDIYEAYREIEIKPLSNSLSCCSTFPNESGLRIYFDVYEDSHLLGGNSWFDVSSQRYLSHSYKILYAGSFDNMSYLPKYVFVEYKSNYVLKPEIFEKIVDTTYAYDLIKDNVQETIDLDLLSKKPYEEITITFNSTPNWSKIKELCIEKGFNVLSNTFYNIDNIISVNTTGRMTLGYNRSSDYWYLKIGTNSSDDTNYNIIVSNNFTRTYYNSGSQTQSITADTWYSQTSEDDAWVQISTPTPVINKTLIENKYLFGAVFNYVNTLEDKFNSISQFPACPTDTDGTYVLEATVADGEVTYNWVLKSS